MTVLTERRAHARAPVQVDVDTDGERNFCYTISLGRRLNLLIELDEQSDHNFYAGLTNDISEGGVFIATSVPLPVGTLVVMSIQLPSAPDPVRIEGEVRWMREPEICRDGVVPGFGVQFRGLAADSLAAIRAYVELHETIYFEAA